jgi:hypothetical protein
MAEDSALRVQTIAAAARVPLSAASAARVATATAPTVKRMADGPVEYPFETEPSTYAVVARRDFDR